jgi:hypothetical protein
MDASHIYHETKVHDTESGHQKIDLTLYSGYSGAPVVDSDNNVQSMVTHKTGSETFGIKLNEHVFHRILSEENDIKLCLAMKEFKN